MSLVYDTVCSSPKQAMSGKKREATMDCWWLKQRTASSPVIGRVVARKKCVKQVHCSLKIKEVVKNSCHMCRCEEYEGEQSKDGTKVGDLLDLPRPWESLQNDSGFS